MQINELWQRALDTLQDRLSRPSYETLKPAQVHSLENNQLIVHTPNDFSRDWLRERCAEDINQVIRELTGSELYVTFVTNERLDLGTGPQEAPVINSDDRRANLRGIGGLNPKYTFDTFVVGNHNRFAHAAALRVAESPAQAYNPLFIYGGVGLGKTHLMHAIGQALLARNPNTKVAYLSTERFTNELINSIRDDRMTDFRNRYRSIDLLLIDDIQFIENKERTQEEFFHTFNALHEAGKQIVISSDRQPKDMAALEDRLRSRFEWGLITDIQPPDLETRIAILKKKADMDGLYPPNEVLQYIASTYQNNVRELEGAFIRVMAYASLTGSPVTVPLAQSILGSAPSRDVTIDGIQDLVARHFRLEVSDLLGNQRNREVAWARQVAMYLARELTTYSLPKIGDAFGGRDHTTVMHAYDKVKKTIAANQTLAQELQELVGRLR